MTSEHPALRDSTDLSEATVLAHMRLWLDRAVIGLNLLTLWDDRGALDEYIEPLRAWAEAGQIRPVVAEAFPLERGADAHRYVGEGRNIGKVVLTV